MQAALAGEHACVYGYGVIGANLGGDEQAAARRARQAHEAQRDALHDHVLALDAAPEAALPAYALPFDVDDAASARELAATLEERLAAVYVDLVAAGPEDDLRAFAAETLIDVAVEHTRWTGSTTAFPGLENR
ncbi:ferritin-like domain-containing protein [Phytoactinopolyspora endophytica]|uniref:ferritin-like domain-containing protein n=1 Tax=Phytoactinopolyspora endophytica TaxID=1642495 RepID=UPI00197B60F7|nr:ferritin-like domain-containing protein [Phytoactinopolyspora endophytica]